MKRSLYAIRDHKANDIVGGVSQFGADAVAIRFFGDVCSDNRQGNVIATHVEDFELVKLCDLNADGSIDANSVLDGYQVVITGAAWKASQAPAQEPGQLTLGVVK